MTNSNSIRIERINPAECRGVWPVIKMNREEVRALYPSSTPEREPILRLDRVAVIAAEREIADPDYSQEHERKMREAHREWVARRGITEDDTWVRPGFEERREG